MVAIPEDTDTRKELVAKAKSILKLGSKVDSAPALAGEGAAAAAAAAEQKQQKKKRKKDAEGVEGEREAAEGEGAAPKMLRK